MSFSFSHKEWVQCLCVWVSFGFTYFSLSKCFHQNWGWLQKRLCCQGARQSLPLHWFPFSTMLEIPGNQKLLSVSRHANQQCLFHGCHAKPGSGKPVSWVPPWNWVIDFLFSKVPKICLRMKTQFGCKAELLFRETGVSALLLPPFMNQIVEWEKELFLLHRNSSVAIVSV